jgi:hypothetical protein
VAGRALLLCVVCALLYAPGAPAGPPKARSKRGFAARLGSEPLKHSRYALRVAAVDTAGNRAKPVSVAFSVGR